MATVLSLINQVLLRTGQATFTTVANVVAPASQTLEYLNSVLSDLYLFLNASWLYQSSYINTESDKNSYGLPVDVEFNRLLDYTITPFGETVSLSQVPTHHSKKLNVLTKGKPGFFWMQDHKLYLWPTPDTAYKLEFLYKPKAPDLLVDNQQLNLPQAWLEALLLGTQAYLERFLGESNASDTFALYQRQIATLRASNQKQQKKRIKAPYQAYRRRY